MNYIFKITMKKKKTKKKKKKPLVKIESVQLTKKLLQKEIKYITKYAERGVSKVITLGDVFLFFSTVEGDSWLLDTEDKMALQLSEEGRILPYKIMDTGGSLAIEWKAGYAIIENEFAVNFKNGNMRIFSNYPVAEIQNRIDEAVKYSKMPIDNR